MRAVLVRTVTLAASLPLTGCKKKAAETVPDSNTPQAANPGISTPTGGVPSNPVTPKQSDDPRVAEAKKELIGKWENRLSDVYSKTVEYKADGTFVYEVLPKGPKISGTWIIEKVERTPGELTRLYMEWTIPGQTHVKNIAAFSDRDLQPELQSLALEDVIAGKGKFNSTFRRQR
jgi:hypothetical protein